MKGPKQRGEYSPYLALVDCACLAVDRRSWAFLALGSLTNAGKDLAVKVQSEFLGLGFFEWLKSDIAHKELCVITLKSVFLEMCFFKTQNTISQEEK